MPGKSCRMAAVIFEQIGGYRIVGIDGEGAAEVRLGRDELAEIADALSADPELLLEVPEFKPLYDEVTAAFVAAPL